MFITLLWATKAPRIAPFYVDRGIKDKWVGTYGTLGRQKSSLLINSFFHSSSGMFTLPDHNILPSIPPPPRTHKAPLSIRISSTSWSMERKKSLSGIKIQPIDGAADSVQRFVSSPVHMFPGELSSHSPVHNSSATVDQSMASVSLYAWASFSHVLMHATILQNLYVISGVISFYTAC